MVDELEFKRRTKELALRVIRLAEALPRNPTSDVIVRQLLRSATSVGANYRSACRAKSTRDMIAKLAIVEEEADETLFWLELIADSRLMSLERIADLMDETEQLLSMTVASIRTLRSRSATANPKSPIRNPK